MDWTPLLTRPSSVVNVVQASPSKRETPPKVPNHSAPSEATAMDRTLLSARPSSAV